ncbi:hypothetical protein NDN08_007562 [Rhodosorus marinus]|uniref:Galactosyltransferase C-terminal domain-containing protein n=1 Tax=Rhodosorus marinus TaxID=101924 RepID=A0AAV8V3K6_9RHOD|nr:hypothetical protein NDN08_007562 [Rhodosorus marinus]
MDRPRKSFRKVLADWNLQWKLLGQQRRGFGLVLVGVLLTAIFLIVWIRGGRVSVLQNLVSAAKRTACPCLRSDSNAKSLLSVAGFVSKAYHKGFSKDRLYAIFGTRRMYSGPLQVAHLDIAVKLDDLQICTNLVTAEGSALERLGNYFSKEESYLMIAGDTQSISLVCQWNTREDLILLQPISCGSVLLTKWAMVNRSVQKVLNREDESNRQLWWRRTGPAEPESEWWLEDGISIVTAVMDRTAQFIEAVKSWSSAQGVDEIVVVDWSSQRSVRSELAKAAPEILSDPRFRIYRVENESRWVLSRAFNLCARLARRRQIFKADGDTAISGDFFKKHRLQPNQFFGGDWKELDDVHMNGALYLYRSDFFGVNGYDERLTTYGWDDSDLAARLVEERGLAFSEFDRTSLHSVNHPDFLRLQKQTALALVDVKNVFGPAIEVQRNRIMLTKMGISQWGDGYAGVHYNLEMRSMSLRGLPPQELQASTRVKSIEEELTKEQIEDASKRAIRIILTRKAMVEPFPADYSLSFYQELASALGDPKSFVHWNVILDGTLAERILALSAVRALKDTTNKKHAWYVTYTWVSPTDSCNCNLSSLVNQHDLPLREVRSPDSKFDYEEVTDVTEMKSQGELGDTLNVRIRCGVPINFELKEQVRRMLRDWIPSDSALAPLRKLKVRALDRHQRWRVDDSGFMGKWTGQSEIREFEDTVDMFVSEERSRKGLQYCDNSSSPTFAIYKDYPELAIILTALYKARIPCLVAT